jgi:hypothetical protein
MFIFTNHIFWKILFFFCPIPYFIFDSDIFHLSDQTSFLFSRQMALLWRRLEKYIYVKHSPFPVICTVHCTVQGAQAAGTGQPLPSQSASAPHGMGHGWLICILSMSNLRSGQSSSHSSRPQLVGPVQGCAGASSWLARDKTLWWMWLAPCQQDVPCTLLWMVYWHYQAVIIPLEMLLRQETLTGPNRTCESDNDGSWDWSPVPGTHSAQCLQAGIHYDHFSMWSLNFLMVFFVKYINKRRFFAKQNFALGRSTGNADRVL